LARETKINIPIMFCFDKNYVIPAAVAFYSLMENASKNYNYTFYILHSDIEEKQELKLKETIKEFKNCELEFINMDNKLEDFWKENYKGGHFSKEVMYKLLVASLFPNLDKIIVSDVDVVFLNGTRTSPSAYQLILLFFRFWNKFHNIPDIHFKRSANLVQHCQRHFFVTPQPRHSIRRNASSFAQICLAHFPIHKELPEFII